MTTQDEEFIRVAIGLTKQARAVDEHPFGAVLVYQNEIVHKAHEFENRSRNNNIL